MSYLANQSFTDNEVLVDIESFVEKLIEHKYSRKQFYDELVNLLFRFKDMMDWDACYSPFVDTFKNIIVDYNFYFTDRESLKYELKRKSIKEWFEYFSSFAASQSGMIIQHRYSENLNKSNLINRLDYLIQNYSSILVVRVDFGYRHKVPLEQVVSDFERFKKKLTYTQYGREKLLFVWALEQGESKGFHYHIAILFDGSSRYGAYKIASDLGEIWKKVTQGNGIYFNCHDRAYLAEFERRGKTGIGMINSNFQPQVDNMKDTLGYLTQPDKGQHLRVKTSPKMRTFGMSQL